MYRNSKRCVGSSVGCEVSVMVVPVLTCIRLAMARTACRYGDFDLELRPAIFLLHDHLCRPIELWEIDDFPFHSFPPKHLVALRSVKFRSDGAMSRGVPTGHSNPKRVVIGVMPRVFCLSNKYSV